MYPYNQGLPGTHWSHSGVSTEEPSINFHNTLDDAEAMVNELYDPNLGMEVQEAPARPVENHREPTLSNPPLFRRGFASLCSRDVQIQLNNLKQNGLDAGYGSNTVQNWVKEMAQFELWMQKSRPGLSFHPNPQDPRILEAAEAYMRENSVWRHFNTALNFMTGHGRPR